MLAFVDDLNNIDYIKARLMDSNNNNSPFFVIIRNGKIYVWLKYIDRK